MLVGSTCSVITLPGVVVAGVAISVAGNAPTFTSLEVTTGELNEGQIWEAAAYVAAQPLGNVLAIVDRNGVQVDGRTEEILEFGRMLLRDNESVPARNWANVEECQQVVVFVDPGSRSFAANDLAEDACAHGLTLGARSK